MNLTHKFLAVVILTAFTVSCENSEAELVDYRLVYNNPVINIEYVTNTVSVAFANTVTSADNLVAEFILSGGAEAYVNGKIQKSGVSENSCEKPFSFQIVSEDEKTVKNWQIVSSNNDFTAKWGKGGFLKSSKSLDRDIVTNIRTVSVRGRTGITAAKIFTPQHSAPGTMHLSFLIQHLKRLIRIP